MASVCNNCRKKLSCGCQKAKASDGASVCKGCKASYEASVKKENLNKFVK